MSVVGLDVGNDNCIVAVARQRGIDVVLNDESKRETPALVAFNEKQRFIGTAAAASITMNPKNTISQIKRLIGRHFQDPDVQQDLSLLPLHVTESPDGHLLVHVHYLGESRGFTPTQVLGMILSNLKSIAEKNLQTHVSDCVIGIPIFFNEIQRRAVLNAAAVAGLHPLRLMHETTATALAYGIYKTDLPENDPINVVFVDVGHASMQVCVVAFKKGQLKVLAHAFDRSLGGRDFDEILFQYFCGKFKEDYRMDVKSNHRACQRLRAACEKLKKVLSANPEAPLNIECLMDEKDVRGHMKRDDFERLAQPIFDRVMQLCQRALSEANIETDKIYSVEVVGSGSRVPAILKILTAVFKKEPSRTMNASECIARGCTLQCAMLSPTFRVREFEVQDSFPFSISLAWKGSAPESEEGATTEAQSSSVVFPKGNSVPSTKMLTFYRASTFTIDVLYTDMHDLPPGTSQKLNTFTIGPFQPSTAEKAKIKVKIRLNLHGIVSVESATMIEEEETDVPVMTSKDAESAMEADKGPIADERDDGGDTKTTAGAENGAAAEQKSGEMDVDPPKKDAAKKKKSKRKDVPVSEHVVGGIPQAELQKAIEKEYEMALQDRVMEETKDKKNAVEAYVYDMRNKDLNGEFWATCVITTRDQAIQSDLCAGEEGATFSHQQSRDSMIESLVEETLQVPEMEVRDPLEIQSTVEEAMQLMPPRPSEPPCTWFRLDLGAVLMQEGRVIAYESRMFSKSEMTAQIFEKELLAVIHALTQWRHYLLGADFTVFTDHQSLRYFLSQKQLSEKQMRWANILSQFHFQIVHVQGQKNVVADALSRKPLVQAISAIHHSTFEDMIDQYAADPDFADIFTRIRDGERVAGYSLREGYLMRKTMLCVTQPLREKVMTECHCPPYTGHRGIATTMKGVEKYFYWPRLKKDVEEFVRSCLLYEKYNEHATDAERGGLAAKLQETEDWLYDEGEDETKGVYVAKLAELKKLGDPIEERFKEEESRGPCLEQLIYCINSFREAARSKDPKFDHIDAADKEKVIMECNKAEDWLREKKQQQDHLPRSANPVLLCTEVKKKTETVDRICKPVMMKPRPPPPKPAPASPEPKSTAGKDAEKNASDGPGTESAGSGDPMEAENADLGEAMEV
ncbi:hypothetical protein L7F22_068901 [Adiantum nelumboides]|nr:hypothetical protein [Adiantum nelumboides]